MKTAHWMWMLAATVGIAAGLMAMPCRGQEAPGETEENIWAEEGPGRAGPGSGGPQLDEGRMIERMMAHVRQADRQKADELERLQKEDPDAFREEIRRMFRENMEQRMRERGVRPRIPEAQPGIAEGPEGSSRHRSDRGGGPREGMREQMRERHEEYIAWLDQNFPAEAAELAKVKAENPDAYPRRLAISMKKYLRIFEASKEHPEMVPVLKEDLLLKEKRGELLRKIKGTTDEAQKQALMQELKGVVSQRFDVIVRRKQLAYEDLARKLEELRKEVDRQKAEVEKWKDQQFKEKSVNEHVQELITQTEKFEWD